MIMGMHEHKIVKILESVKVDCYYAYSIEMDCPVQPLKVVITKVSGKAHGFSRGMKANDLPNL